MSLPHVYFDMTADGAPIGRIVMEVGHTLPFDPSAIFISVCLQLRTDVVPKTCENFRCLCTGGPHPKLAAQVDDTAHHRRERLWLQRLDLPSHHSRIHVPRWRLY